MTWREAHEGEEQLDTDASLDVFSDGSLFNVKPFFKLGKQIGQRPYERGEHHIAPFKKEPFGFCNLNLPVGNFLR